MAAQQLFHSTILFCLFIKCNRKLLWELSWNWIWNARSFTFTRAAVCEWIIAIWFLSWDTVMNKLNFETLCWSVLPCQLNTELNPTCYWCYRSRCVKVWIDVSHFWISIKLTGVLFSVVHVNILGAVVLLIIVLLILFFKGPSLCTVFIYI